MFTCKKCGFEDVEENKMDMHHIVPKVMGGTDADGRRRLCRENEGNDCHRKLHAWLREQQDIKDLMKRKFQEWIEKDD